ncbi:MAG: hypothetical protein C0616_01050 [Desulfuromonas sp.]|nr:MAG: hypothetical protein C0616_01050 [Desulfuromonas sp.]
MSQLNQDKLHGLASLYTKKEIKKFLSGFVITLLVVEGLIFFFCYISFLGGQVETFPWKAYLLAAFLSPVAITFLVGMMAYGFNRYMFERSGSESQVFEESTDGGRFDLFLSSIQRVPFLLSLLLLVAGGGVIFKLDAIAAFMLNAGEQVARSLLILVGAILGVATLVGLVWMFLSYRLRRQRLELLHDYRKDVMQRTGMIMLEDETVIDSEGKVVKVPDMPRGAGQGMTLLPPLLRKSKQKNEEKLGNE